VRKKPNFSFLVGSKRNFGIAESKTKKRIHFKIESSGAIIVFLNFSEKKKEGWHFDHLPIWG
jgi:hypothetical protein